MTQEPMGLDDHVEPAVAKDLDGIPYCRKHHCRMTQTSGGAKGSRKAYYKCPVAKCDETGVRIKTTIEGLVPKDPVECPRCKVVCERDVKRSTPASVVLSCPECNWGSPAFASPQFAAAHMGRRSVLQHEANVGER